MNQLATAHTPSPGRPPTTATAAGERQPRPRTGSSPPIRRSRRSPPPACTSTCRPPSRPPSRPRPGAPGRDDVRLLVSIGTEAPVHARFDDLPDFLEPGRPAGGEHLGHHGRLARRGGPAAAPAGGAPVHPTALGAVAGRGAPARRPGHPARLRRPRRHHPGSGRRRHRAHPGPLPGTRTGCGWPSSTPAQLDPRRAAGPLRPTHPLRPRPPRLAPRGLPDGVRRHPGQRRDAQRLRVPSPPEVVAPPDEARASARPRSCCTPACPRWRAANARIPSGSRCRPPPPTGSTPTPSRRAGGWWPSAPRWCGRSRARGVPTALAHARSGWTDLVVTPERGVHLVDGLLTGLARTRGLPPADAGGHRRARGAGAGLRRGGGRRLPVARVRRHPPDPAGARPTPALPTSEVERSPSISDSRRSVIDALKRRGEADVDELAAGPGHDPGRCPPAPGHPGRGGPGDQPRDRPRPRRAGPAAGVRYALSARSEPLFPKAYDELANDLLRHAVDEDGTLVERIFVRRRDGRIANARRPAGREANPRGQGGRAGRHPRRGRLPGRLGGPRRRALPHHRAQLRHPGRGQPPPRRLPQRDRVPAGRAARGHASSGCPTSWPAPTSAPT